MNKEQITAKIEELREELNKMEAVISNILQAGIHATDERLKPYRSLFELFEKHILELRDKLEAITKKDK